MRPVKTVALAGLLCACAPSPDAATESRLLAARDRHDTAALRTHGWELWQRLATHWQDLVPADRVLGHSDRMFRPLRPFRDGTVTETETLPVMFSVAFDPSAAAHIRDHALASRAALGKLATFPAFPRSAIAVKLVWYPIHRDRVARIPIWDGEVIAGRNPDRTWRRTVAIDPAQFITRTLTTDAELAAARTIAHDPTLARGDLAVLLGMHVATKETPDWVWATFWWHDRADTGPYAAGRPALPGPAGHYLMDVAYSGDGSCMNPWLEARFPDGVHSNCLTCHQRAAFGATDYLPVTHGTLRADDPYFAGKLPTDFVWTLALEAR